MRYREVARRLKTLGFAFDRRDLPEGTLRAILKQAGIPLDVFLKA